MVLHRICSMFLSHLHSDSQSSLIQILQGHIAVQLLSIRFRLCGLSSVLNSHSWEMTMCRHSEAELIQKYCFDSCCLPTDCLSATLNYSSALAFIYQAI